MARQMSQDQSGSGEQRDEGGTGHFGNAGVGAASALEQMKTQHERRRNRTLGSRAVWPVRDDDSRPAYPSRAGDQSAELISPREE